MNIPKASLSVYAIGLNTFRETVRDKILYSFLFFALLTSGMSILLGTLSVGQDVRILQDIGLTTIVAFGGIIALFSGINLVYKEIEKRTIYVIFSKPINGWQFICGKFLGLALAIFVVIAGMGLFLSLLVSLNQGFFSIMALNAALLSVMPSVLLILLELVFVIALAIFFSSFTSPMMSLLFTSSIWLISHLSDSLKQLGLLSQNQGLSRLSEFIYIVLPDLSSLARVRAELVSGSGGLSDIIGYLTCYLFAYIILLLVLSSILIDRKEFH